MAIAETKFPEGPGRGTDMISRRNFLQVALAGGVLAGVAPLGPAFARVAGPDPVPAVDIQLSRLKTGSD